MPIVLIHGAGGSHLSWPPALRLWEHGAAYALDLPGHGRSSLPAPDNISAAAAAVREFLAALPLPRYALIGHSMGGAVAQQLALDPPQGLAALVLLGTGTKLPVAPRFLNGIQEDFPGTVRLINSFLWSQEVMPDLQELSAALMIDTGAQTIGADLHACNRFDIRKQVTQIKLPMLVICGEEDRMTPPRFSQYIAAQCPQAELILYPGTGHMVAQERPFETAAAIYTFLKNFSAD